MRIVVTGREGQVARALAERCAGRRDLKLVHAARPEFDFERPQVLAEKIAELRPDLVVNAAADTAVDKAESEAERAMTINAVAAGEVARGAAMAGAPIVQISTDYVFDGTLGRPYREGDAASPLGVYGRTKLAGENAVASMNLRHIVLRTAWIYSPFSRNFVRTMLRLAQTKDEIDVVADQLGNPTSAFVVADGILAIVDRLASDNDCAPWGIYHLAAAGSASWNEFATAIFALTGPFFDKAPRLRAIATADYPTLARRPADARLDTSLFQATFGYCPPEWRAALADDLRRPGWTE